MRSFLALFSMLSPDRQAELCISNAQYFQNPPLTKESALQNQDGCKYDTKYITTNTWPRSSRGRKLKKGSSRQLIHGIEVKTLPDGHPLSGELGLFAARHFQQFDIVGEYCGEVIEEGGGRYAAYLEDKNKKYALGVDASQEGNELRFINHYDNIAEAANVVMKIAYVEELPRIMAVCLKDVNVGEEFLFQYSKEYVDEYLS